ncbi:leucine-rich repeat-containing protein let-4-like [Anopheles darlingi]|uniref:leucine-rich repeat-containing protein let-4-like n=1 Tax=Anopheles darlingi TaxID=43151 RepID=UPI002100072E|nr:leucine-rich repeat-containing protein let-4-like [Anopheles darlingi]
MLRPVSYVPVVTVVALMGFAVLIHGQCSTDDELECYIALINMTSGGFVRLQRIFATTSYPGYTVQRLIVANSASGAFLQRIGQLSKSIIYIQYNEQVFLLPEGNELIYVIITNAPTLRFFIAGRNDQLETLRIENSLLNVIPSTLAQLTQLQLLQINRSPLALLHLDTLAKNPSLLYVELLENRIAKIIPPTDPGAVLSVQQLSLSSNWIVHLDLGVFERAKNLNFLDLRNNRLLTITTKVSLPKLSSLFLDGNRLSSFDLPSLQTPLLHTLSLSANNFTEMLSQWEDKSELRYVSFDTNRIRTFDFATVRPLKKLASISLTDNMIQTVFASPPVVELPLLQGIYLSDQNAFVDIPTNWPKMPELQSLSMSNNNLKAANLTSLRVFPNLQYLFLYDNQITTFQNM